MSVCDVPRARWAGVLEQFSLAYRGWRASVATVRPGAELAFRTGWYPLESVAIARTGTRPAAILVNFQGAPAVCVRGPRALAVGTRGDGAERALEIDGAGGEFVRLVFRATAGPEEVDGIAPAERVEPREPVAVTNRRGHGHPAGRASRRRKRDLSMRDSTAQGDDTSTPLSLSEAVVTVLVGCVAVDGVLKAEEASRLNEALSSTRWVLGTGTAVAADVTTRAINLLTERGLPAVLGACAKAIPGTLHATTFALAMDLVLADGRLGDRENALVDTLQRALQLDGDLARKIVDVLLIKNRASGRPDL